MYCQLVSEFLEGSQEAKPTRIQQFSPQEIDFLCTMITDELKELKDAPDLCDQVDALVDLIYYVCHASMKKGINLDAFFHIVHQANMAKFTHGVLRREDGKILKPPGWKDPKPALMVELQQQLDNF